jgi:hypothetical protein
MKCHVSRAGDSCWRAGGFSWSLRVLYVGQIKNLLLYFFSDEIKQQNFNFKFFFCAKPGFESGFSREPSGFGLKESRSAALGKNLPPVPG